VPLACRRREFLQDVERPDASAAVSAATVCPSVLCPSDMHSRPITGDGYLKPCLPRPRAPRFQNAFVQQLVKDHRQGPSDAHPENQTSTCVASHRNTVCSRPEHIHLHFSIFRTGLERSASLAIRTYLNGKGPPTSTCVFANCSNVSFFFERLTIMAFMIVKVFERTTVVKLV